MSFTILLIIFAFAIFVVATLLFRWLGEVEQKTGKMSRPNLLFSILCVFLGIFFILSIYYAILGQRTIIWFFVFVLIGILSLYIAGFSTPNFRRLSIIVILVLAVVQSSMPILQNRGIIFGPDQWRDLKITTYIIEKGTFKDYPWLEPGFYSFIPLFNILNAAVSEILGCPAMVTIGILPVFFCLLSVLSIYAILKKLTGNVLISLIAVMIFLSTPRLAIVQAVPSTASISLGILLFFLFIKGAVSFSRNFMSPIALLAFTIAVMHPIGVFIVLIISSGTLLLNHVYAKERLNPRIITFVKGVFAFCLFIPLAYWSSAKEVFAGVFKPLTKFLLSLTKFEKAPSIYTPQYQSAGFEIFSFAWALPVAFSAAYILTTFVTGWRKGSRLSQITLRQVIDVCGLAGLLLILSAFASVMVDPGASVERYVNVIGYSLLILTASFVFGQFLFSKKKIVIFFAVLLLSANIVIGSSSPDWAPFENPAFGAIRYTFTSFIEANTMVNFLPNNIHLYEDHDIPLSSVGSMKNITLITYRSYQPTRAIIQIFKDNSFTPFDPRYHDTVLVIKNDEIIDQNLLYNYVNILYNSGKHIAVDPL
jgi:hypothetical protein